MITGTVLVLRYHIFFHFLGLSICLFYCFLWLICCYLLALTYNLEGMLFSFIILMRVFHWRSRKSKFFQLSKTFLSILTYLKNAVVTIRSLIFSSPSLFSGFLWTFSRANIIKLKIGLKIALFSKFEYLNVIMLIQTSLWYAIFRCSNKDVPMVWNLAAQ